MRGGVGNGNIELNIDRCIPPISFPQDSYLLDRKPVGDRSMQVNGDCSNLGQLNMQVCYWVFLELRKQQRLELSIFLESGKAKPSFLEVLPTSMQLFDGLLENLRRNLAQSGKFLLGSWQVVKLIDFVGKLQVGRENVLMNKGASINQTLTAIAPIFYLPKCIVECTTADFHPLNECLFLSRVWIYTITMSESQHPSIILNLLYSKQPLTANFSTRCP